MSCVILCTGGDHSRRLRHTCKQVLSLCLSISAMIVPVMKTTGLEPPVIHHVRSVLYDRLRRLHGTRRCHGTRSRTNAPAASFALRLHPIHGVITANGPPTDRTRPVRPPIYFLLRFLCPSFSSGRPYPFSPVFPLEFPAPTPRRNRLSPTTSFTAGNQRYSPAERCGGLSI